MPNTKKAFVLDTSVLLYSASSLSSFGGGDVIIPYVVLEELDKFKNRDGIVGSNARQVARKLNEYRKVGCINEGVSINDRGGQLRVELNHHDSKNQLLNTSKNDDRILNVCLGIKDDYDSVTLVTKDINLSVRADVFGVSAEDFDTDRLVSSVDEMYSGSEIVEVPDSVVDAFYAGEDIFPEDIGLDVYPNQYLTLVSEADRGKTALVRAPTATQLSPLVRLRKGEAWGIKARNREQQFAIDALLNKDIKLVTLSGPAGCGKTLCALACALSLVQDGGVYDRLVVSRPVQPLGKDIGYLPGSAAEKMDPWMGPIKDALEFLMRGRGKGRGSMFDEMVDLKMLEVEPLTYIRGRSMPNTLFILDEAQDISRAEVKTVVSRIGENSKLVLIGDVLQVSNPYLDSTNNGLSNVIEKFKPYPFAAHVTLVRGERSELATVASEIL